MQVKPAESFYTHIHTNLVLPMQIYVEINQKDELAKYKLYGTASLTNIYVNLFQIQ